nr:hypothetical protein [Tanacetum cinerariifolium]
MIKFPMANGIATMVTKGETLPVCRRIEEAEGPTPERRVTHPRISASEPQDAPRAKETKISERQYLEEKHPEEAEPPQPPKVTVKDNHPDQPITIGGNLSAKCRAKLIRVLRKHVDAFAWVLADVTVIPRFVTEHELKTYPHMEPRVQRKMSIAWTEGSSCSATKRGITVTSAKTHAKASTCLRRTLISFALHFADKFPPMVIVISTFGGCGGSASSGCFSSRYCLFEIFVSFALGASWGSEALIRGCVTLFSGVGPSASSILRHTGRVSPLVTMVSIPFAIGNFIIAWIVDAKDPRLLVPI